MPPRRPSGQAAAARPQRSTLSARQWQDIRQASRLARSEGVVIEVHGFRCSPAEDTTRTAACRPPAGGTAVEREPPDAAPSASGEEQNGEPMDTDVSPNAPTPQTPKQLKKLERDALRARTNRARKCIHGWHKFAHNLKYRHVVSPAWTALQRACVARRRIRDALWRAWTWRYAKDAEGDGVLGLISRRDAYVFNRAENFCHQSLGRLPWLRMGKGKVWIDHSEEQKSVGDMEEEAALQAAIAASLTPDVPKLPAPAENREGEGRNTAKATSSEAGLKTPGSARRGGKKSRGGRRVET